MPEIMARAWERMAVVGPFGLLGALVWFIIAYFAHDRMIDTQPDVRHGPFGSTLGR